MSSRESGFGGVVTAINYNHPHPYVSLCKHVFLSSAMFCVVTFEHVCLQMRGFYIQLSHYSKHMCYLMRKIYHFTSYQKKYHAILYRSNFHYVYLDTFSFENEPKVDISYFTFTFWSEEKRMETFGWIQITLPKIYRIWRVRWHDTQNDELFFALVASEKWATLD